MKNSICQHYWIDRVETIRFALFVLGVGIGMYFLITLINYNLHIDDISDLSKSVTYLADKTLFFKQEVSPDALNEYKVSVQKLMDIETKYQVSKFRLLVTLGLSSFVSLVAAVFIPSADVLKEIFVKINLDCPLDD